MACREDEGLDLFQSQSHTGNVHRVTGGRRPAVAVVIHRNGRWFLTSPIVAAAILCRSMTTATDEGDSLPTTTDLRFLREAIALSAASKDRGRHPFAALVVDRDGQVISRRGNNSMPPEGDPTQHAELTAAAAAARSRPAEDLADATLYTSAEPCAMCTGAVYWTGIGRIVYGLSEKRLATLTGADPENPTMDLPCREVAARGQRRIEIIGPLLEDEAAEPHSGFWRS